MRKIILSLTILLGSVSAGKAQGFKPTVALLGTFTHTQTNLVAESGTFNVQNQTQSIGLELSHKFYLTNDAFFKTGVRINGYKTTVEALNQFPEAQQAPFSLTWSREYQSFSAPLVFGKDFEVGGRRGDYFVGFSAGVLAFSTLGMGTSSGNDFPYGDTLQSFVADSVIGRFPIYFLSTFDFGGSIQPFKNAPALRVGAQCAIQLTKTKPYNYSGTATNISQGQTFDYRFSMAPHFTNASLFVSYTFGKPRVAKINPYECPK